MRYRIGITVLAFSLGWAYGQEVRKRTVYDEVRVIVNQGMDECRQRSSIPLFLICLENHLAEVRSKETYGPTEVKKEELTKDEQGNPIK